MKSISLVAVGIVFLSACVLGGPNVSKDTYRFEIVKGGLERPWSLAFLPNGQLLYTTKYTGRLESLDIRTGNVTTYETPLQNFRPDGEGGLMGLELDPNFAQNNRVFVCYSYWKNGTNNDSDKRNRLSSFVLKNAAATNEKILMDDMPGWWNHNGCRVRVGPDDHLYFTMGDANGQTGGPNKAQDLQSLGGKTMRLTKDGAIPTDNPFYATATGANRAIWSYGHRNQQGLAFHPITKQLWATEHGPDVKDELNVIFKGKNYGWPLNECMGASSETKNCTLENFQPAVKSYNPDSTVAIGDMAFYTGSAFATWKNSLMFLTLKTGRIYRLELNGDTISKEELLTKNDLDYGRLRAIAVGPDGFVYVATDNGLDSKIIRIRPN